MIKAKVKIGEDWFEVESSDQKKMHAELSSLYEVFGNNICQKCKSKAVPTIRENDGNTYYEWRCTNPKCRAKLSMGCHKTSPTLFPKRTTEDDTGKSTYLPDGGWLRYNKETGKNE
jgi:hypothetical protein